MWLEIINILWLQKVVETGDVDGLMHREISFILISVSFRRIDQVLPLELSGFITRDEPNFG